MATRQNLLSDEELAALSEGLKDGSIETDTGFNTKVRVRKHDLASENSSLGVNVSAIDMINERFIRTFRLGLLEMLRTTPRINPRRVEIVRFGDYLKSLTPPLSVNMVRMNPLRGNSLVVIDPTVVFSSLDSFFGGFGRGVGVAVSLRHRRALAVALLQTRQTLIIDRIGGLFGEQLGLVFLTAEGVQGVQRGAASG